MVPFTIYSPLSLISLVAGFLNLPNNAPQMPVKSVAPVISPAPVSNALITPSQIPALKPTHTAVRDFVQSLNLDAHRLHPGPNDAPPSQVLPLNPDLGAQSNDIDEISVEEDQLVALINRERVSEGLNELTEDPLLTSIARSHSEDMSSRGYFDHRAPSPGPVTPMDRYLAAAPVRPDYAMVGENIYYRSTTDSISDYASQAHDAFMNSPGHRANILMPQYTRVGVGIYRNAATGEYWVTEMFLRDTQ